MKLVNLCIFAMANFSFYSLPLLLLLSRFTIGDEYYEGSGTMTCFGDMSITLNSFTSAEVTGILNCQPSASIYASHSTVAGADP